MSVFCLRQLYVHVCVCVYEMFFLNLKTVDFHNLKINLFVIIWKTKTRISYSNMFVFFMKHLVNYSIFKWQNHLIFGNSLKMAKHDHNTNTCTNCKQKRKYNLLFKWQSIESTQTFTYTQGGRYRHQRIYIYIYLNVYRLIFEPHFNTQFYLW